MDSKQFWTVSFVFGFLPWEVKAGHGIANSPSRMTWLESFGYCKLASENSIQHLVDGEYRGWAGGIYLNTQWMFHQGCLRNTGTLNFNSTYDIDLLTSTVCSEKCKMFPYFALKHNWCVCLYSLYNLENSDPSKCTYKCLGLKKETCGERSYFTVYKHITGKTKPEDDVDQKLSCSVVVPRNDTFVLKPVDCFSKYWTTCIISGDTKQMGIRETFQSAISRCSSSNGTILSIYNNLDNLEDGREYWSNIYRSKFLKWITTESFHEICYEVEGVLNVDCLYLKVRYRALEFIPLPCNYKYTTICKPKQPGDTDVIRQCPNNNATNAITGAQPESEHSNITSNKPDPTPINTETVFLTSSLESMSTHFEPTTSDYTNPVTQSSPKTVSTTFVSTNSDYTDSFKPSFTKEHSFVWYTSVPVSVSPSHTSMTDTTVGTLMEVPTLVAQTDNDNRTVANDTTNDGLIYSVIFSLVPASVALAVLIIMAVLITVVRRRRREKAHPEGNGLQTELGALQPIIEYEKKSYDNQRNYWKTQDRVNPDCQINDEANDQYRHLDFNVRSKEPTCFEAEYGYGMATTSFLKPDLKNPSTNSALKIAMAKRAKMLRTSLHFLQGPFTKQRSEKENVAYCDTAIVHTKFLYDTPQQSIKHVNKP